ncbi:MAG: hydrogenase expression/formation protein HypE [candidate division WS1 bacterium]|nr:hydrogenase expression/formation protein HypE [candidate division WS1 bacterium]
MSSPHDSSHTISLGHGSGGAMMQQLIAEELLPALSGQSAEALEDAAIVELAGGRLAFTTDSYVVQPLLFPGGDIGSLAVHGTVNDLAMRGAVPRFLSVGLIIEEGLPVDTLRRVVASMGCAADKCGVTIACGDTKVVEHGKGDGLFINTSGLGECGPHVPSVTAAQPGDVLIVNGTLGDHGIAVMVAREQLEISADLRSDSAPLHELVAAMLQAGGDAVHCLRDLTRGGMAAGLNEIATSSAVGMMLESSAIPVRPDVAGVCEILGLSPYVVANEGKLVAAVAADQADSVLQAMHAHPYGQDAAIIGQVVSDQPGLVRLRTAIGTTRVLELPAGELLPRIC